MSVRFNGEIVEKSRELADAIKAGCEVKGNHISEKESHSAYNAHLPEGFTPDSIKELGKYHANYVRAAHIAAGELSADIFKKDSNAKTATMSVGYFVPTDGLNFTVERSRQYPNPQAGDGSEDKITKDLVITMGATHKANSVKSLRNAMSEQFKNSFK